MLRFFKQLFGKKRRGGAPAAWSGSVQAEIENKLDYQFDNPLLLLEALTHRSHPHGNGSQAAAYERLEFLGDSVLGLVVAERLFSQYPDMPEGELTKNKSVLVNKKSLAHAARSIGLGDYILMSPDEDRSGGRQRESIMADCLEALIGAVYADGGLLPARRLVERLVSFDFTETGSRLGLRNYKGDLLELLQAESAAMPVYRVVDERGPDHRKTFTVEVLVNGEVMGTGSGESKKSAEQKAARQALRKMKSMISSKKE
jgi:ribonuclease-3